MNGVSLMARLVGATGAFFIYRLISIFGRTHERARIAWLMGRLVAA